MSKPLVIDLFCGLGGWSKGFLSEGWEAVGFDIERHQYGEKRYPAQLVLQDVLTLHGRQFRDAAAIVASPPCQRYSYMAMPWRRAKVEIAWQEYSRGGSPFAPVWDLNDLFEACFRLQREASEGAGRPIPLVVENVCGAQRWVGRAAWHYGSYYLWGDVPALMPSTLRVKSPGRNFHVHELTGGAVSSPSFHGADHETRGLGLGVKTVGHVNIRDGHSHTRHLTNQGESDAVKHGGDWFSDPSSPGRQGGVKVGGIKLSAVGFNVAAAQRYREGVKQPGLSGPAWFDQGAAAFSVRSNSRKAASAAIAEIPFELSAWIACCFKP